MARGALHYKYTIAKVLQQTPRNKGVAVLSLLLAVAVDCVPSMSLPAKMGQCDFCTCAQLLLLLLLFVLLLLLWLFFFFFALILYCWCNVTCISHIILVILHSSNMSVCLSICLSLIYTRAMLRFLFFFFQTLNCILWLFLTLTIRRSSLTNWFVCPLHFLH